LDLISSPHSVSFFFCIQPRLEFEFGCSCSTQPCRNSRLVCAARRKATVRQSVRLSAAHARVPFGPSTNFGFLFRLPFCPLLPRHLHRIRILPPLGSDRMMDSACVWSSRRTAEAVNRSRSTFCPVPSQLFVWLFFRGGGVLTHSSTWAVRLRFIWLPFDLHKYLSLDFPKLVLFFGKL